MSLFGGGTELIESVDTLQGKLTLSRTVDHRYSKGTIKTKITHSVELVDVEGHKIQGVIYWVTKAKAVQAYKRVLKWGINEYLIKFA